MNSSCRSGTLSATKPTGCLSPRHISSPSSWIPGGASPPPPAWRTQILSSLTETPAPCRTAFETTSLTGTLLRGDYKSSRKIAKTSSGRRRTWAAARESCSWSADKTPGQHVAVLDPFSVAEVVHTPCRVPPRHRAVACILLADEGLHGRRHLLEFSEVGRAADAVIGATSIQGRTRPWR